MATFTARTLGAGQVQSGLNAIYSVAGAMKAYVKNIWLYNDSAISQTIILALNINSATRTWRRIILEPNESASVLEGEEALVLSEGNSILATATSPLSVNYSVHGVEEGA